MISEETISAPPWDALAEQGCLPFLVSALQDQGSAWPDELIGIQVEFHHRSCKVGTGSQKQALVDVRQDTTCS